MKKILIADDDPVIVKLLEFTLKKADYDVITCREGKCVKTMTEQEKPILAILDLVLPGRTGLELVNDFRSDPILEKLPIIIITQQGKGSIRNELLQAGASSVFTKPFSPKLLLKEINQLTQNN